MMMSRDLEKYAADYSHDYGFERWQVMFRRRAVLKHCSVLNPEHVLEVGCGVEPLFLHFPPVSSWHVVEPSAPFAEMARTHALGLDGVQIVEGFIESSLETLASLQHHNPFDLIIAGGVLQEVPDPQSFLLSIRSLCSAATVVHVNVPNADSWHRRTALAMGLLSSSCQPSERASMLQQRVVYDRRTLVSEVKQAGFQVIAHGGIFFKPFDHARMLAALDCGVLTEAHLEAYAQLGEELPHLASEIWVHLRRTA